MAKSLLLMQLGLLIPDIFLSFSRRNLLKRLPVLFLYSIWTIIFSAKKVLQRETTPWGVVSHWRLKMKRERKKWKSNCSCKAYDSKRMLRKIACKRYKSMKNSAVLHPFLYMERARRLIAQPTQHLEKKAARNYYILRIFLLTSTISCGNIPLLLMLCASPNGGWLICLLRGNLVFPALHT